MASMATHFSNQNSGIIFSSVETNVGNFFDVMTGRFGAPVNGEYLQTKDCNSQTSGEKHGQ